MSIPKLTANKQRKHLFQKSFRKRRELKIFGFYIRKIFCNFLKVDEKSGKHAPFQDLLIIFIAVFLTQILCNCNGHICIYKIDKEKQILKNHLIFTSIIDQTKMCVREGSNLRLYFLRKKEANVVFYKNRSTFKIQSKKYQ